MRTTFSATYDEGGRAARAEQDVRRAENSYASAKVALATLLSRDDANFEVQAPEPPAPPEGSPEDLVAKAASERLDVLAANKSIELAKKGKQGALAKYLPNLFLTGAYRWANVKGFTGESTSWNVGLALSWNLFDGGLREAELKEHDSKIVEAKAARRSAELKARDDLLKRIKKLAPEDRKAWADAVREYVEKFELPEDVYLLGE